MCHRTVSVPYGPCLGLYALSSSPDRLPAMSKGMCQDSGLGKEGGEVLKRGSIIPSPPPPLFCEGKAFRIYFSGPLYCALSTHRLPPGSFTDPSQSNRNPNDPPPFENGCFTGM